MQSPGFESRNPDTKKKVSNNIILFCKFHEVNKSIMCNLRGLTLNPFKQT